MSAVNHSRRSLFRGKRNVELPLRPPWSLYESAFTDVCERCDKCVEVCEEGILVRGDAGFPVVDFSKGECTFCGDCASACPSQAINPKEVTEPWQYNVAIESACLSKQGIVCQSCKDVCDPRAIKLVWDSAIPVPQIEQEDCTACGACVSVCPSNAISVKNVRSPEAERL